jgi:hypothetical protein
MVSRVQVVFMVFRVQVVFMVLYGVQGIGCVYGVQGTSGVYVGPGTSGVNGVQGKDEGAGSLQVSSSTPESVLEVPSVAATRPAALDSLGSRFVPPPLADEDSWVRWEHGRRVLIQGDTGSPMGRATHSGPAAAPKVALSSQVRFPEEEQYVKKAPVSTFYSKYGIVHMKSPVYEPKSNGSVERVIKTIEEGLRMELKYGIPIQRLSTLCAAALTAHQLCLVILSLIGLDPFFLDFSNSGLSFVKRKF